MPATGFVGSFVRRCALAGALLLPAAAWAVAPTVVPYPAPGGNTATAVGSGPAQGSGIEWTYGGFDPSAYGSLYYGIGNYVGGAFVPGWPTLTFDGTPDVLLFNGSASNLASGLATFSGTSIVYTTTGPRVAYTRLTLTVSDTSGVALELSSPAPPGMPAELGGVLPVLGDYRAHWLLEASFDQDSGYTVANSFFDNVPSKLQGYSVQSSMGGAFYATPVPEPETYALMLAGLLTAGSIVRRRRAHG